MTPNSKPTKIQAIPLITVKGMAFVLCLLLVGQAGALEQEPRPSKPKVERLTLGGLIGGRIQAQQSRNMCYGGSRGMGGLHGKRWVAIPPIKGEKIEFKEAGLFFHKPEGWSHRQEGGSLTLSHAEKQLTISIRAIPRSNVLNDFRKEVQSGLQLTPETRLQSDGKKVQFCNNALAAQFKGNSPGKGPITAYKAVLQSPRYDGVSFTLRSSKPEFSKELMSLLQSIAVSVTFIKAE